MWKMKFSNFDGSYNFLFGGTQYFMIQSALFSDTLTNLSVEMNSKFSWKPPVDVAVADW